ncbi:MAG: HlyC/CorC family transporter [Gammaproteobacteria bacterium]|nr:HlyC/CorC family transporter [Pseudomonadales bacterium]MCP5346575.1 HlyC/CorC family transporter [Pseudomonadales bacterium]
MNNDDTQIGLLLLLLVFLICASAYFSSSETAMMSLNRYRMKHLQRTGHTGARRASRLLEAPDRLIGVILIGNNFVNILAASIATSIAIALFGKPEPLITTGLLTLIILIFAEVTPKTIAALYPEKIAYPSSYLLIILLRLLHPIVLIVNVLSNRLVTLLGFQAHPGDDHQLSKEELRTVVFESAGRLPQRRHGMLLSILDLEKVTVNDILVPRNEVLGIDLDDDLDTILDQIGATQHTRLPVYKGDIDNIVGLLHMRSISKLLKLDNINKAALIQETNEPYFVPESTPLHTQLFNFQKHKKRLAVVVDEFGAVKGIVTLEDILEEIVGEFTTDLATSNREIHPQVDGSFLIDGSATIRDINKLLNWELQSDEAKTLNGLLMELLESIPDSAVCIRIGRYYAEILQVKDNKIRTVKMWEQSADSAESDAYHD